MTELLTAAQMRALEQTAIAGGAVTGLELMERAGRGVVEAILAEWPELGAGERRAVVLCGPGNNGGDGFVVARLLRELGWGVEVFLYGDVAQLPPDARVNYERWGDMGEVRGPSDLQEQPGCAEVTVDALFGAGLGRPLAGEVLGLLTEWRKAPPPGHTVAVDGPSGLCLDSGRQIGGAFPAELTVTFHQAKAGHFLAEGPGLTGKLVVKDIGLTGTVASAVRLVDAKSIGDLQKAGAHKYSHGHALILSGPPARGGAARLAARGALRIGAGLVTVGACVDAIAEHAARLDAVMIRVVGDGAALGEVLADRRINALCLGPGLGLDARAKGLVGAALGAVRASTHPTGERLGLVFDADALTLIAGDAALFGALHSLCVLTPHAGEFARLFPDIAAKLDAPATRGPAYSKVDATREAAARAGCVVLFKGPDTVVAGPEGHCAINFASYDRAAPWLATAGSGDVLAGFIVGLMARRFNAFNAATTAAWLHVECALSFGPGLIAEDLPDELPKVFRALRC